METLDPAVLRNEHDPVPERVARAADPHPPPVAQDLAAARPVAVEPVEEVALPLPLEAAETEDLAAPEREAPRSLPAPELDVPQLEHRLGVGLAPLRREDRAHVAPGHEVDGRPLVDLVDPVLPDRAPVAEDRHPVGERPDLVHPVRDDDDRRPVRAQRANQLEEPLHLGVSERRGRLVEDEDPRLVPHRLRDLDHLPAGRAGGSRPAP